MNKTVWKIKEGVGREAPTLLTIFGVTGLISTSVLVAKGTTEAVEILDLKKDWPDLKERVRLVWRCYIPAGVSGILTIACILGANSINLKRNAALAGMYTVAVEGLKEYQAKVIETVGRKKHEKILEDISKDRIHNNPPKDNLIVLGGGDVLFYDSFSGRYFESTMEKVRRAMNAFNFELFDEMYKSINEFYDMLGLDEVDAGNAVGWHIERGKLEVIFHAKIVNAPESKWHDEPCIVLTYNPDPRYVI